MNCRKKTRKGFINLVLVMCLVLLGTGTTAFGENPGNKKQLVEVSHSSGGIVFTPTVNYGQLLLNVSGPEGMSVTKTFLPGSSPYLSLSDLNGGQLLDGSYTYELKIIPVLAKKTRLANNASAKTGKEVSLQPLKKTTGKTMSQTGYFKIRGGMIITSNQSPEPQRTNDFVPNDDVIVNNSLCVGADCLNNHAFGDDTIALLENRLRVYFNDTSTAAGFPTNDWRILINDTGSGGGEYFAIEDTTEASSPFVIEAGAPSNSLYVDSSGDIGINTSTPGVELHIADGDSPAVRLEQDASYGWPTQTWDLAGNETSFFIRDVTNASRLPFRIEPGAPSNSMYTDQNGNVGLGTSVPAFSFEVQRTGAGAMVVANRTDGATMEFSSTGNFGIAGTRTNHPVKFRVNLTDIMQLNQTGNYIQMLQGGGYYNGNWINGSSRAFKQDISDLSSSDARNALENLQPVTYKYKHNDEEHVGFIAEDVPELVAMKNRKGISSMDIVGVLTKVVKDQQQSIKRQQENIERQSRLIDKLQLRIETLEKNKTK